MVPGALQTPAEGQHRLCKGSVCEREEGMGDADRDGAGGQVVKRTSVSLDFHRKK